MLDDRRFESQQRHKVYLFSKTYTPLWGSKSLFFN
jgi:hypothetical protein